jgi:hypothetical protein
VNRILEVADHLVQVLSRVFRDVACKDLRARMHEKQLINVVSTKLSPSLSHVQCQQTMAKKNQEPETNNSSYDPTDDRFNVAFLRNIMRRCHTRNVNHRCSTHRLVKMTIKESG